MSPSRKAWSPTVRAAIPLLDQTLRQNIAMLAVLIGRAPADFTVKGGSIYGLRIPTVTPGLPSELLFQRPDIRAAEANLASADANVESARAAFFPSISLTAEGGYESEALKLLFTPQSAFYQLVANLAQPLLDGFRLEGQLELAKGRQLELLQALLPDDLGFASATWRSRSSPLPRAPSASACSGRWSQARARPSTSPRPAAAREARSISSPCCKPSRPCSWPKTIWCWRAWRGCRRS